MKAGELQLLVAFNIIVKIENLEPNINKTVKHSLNSSVKMINL